MVKIDMEMPKTCGDCPFVFYAKNCALRIKVVELNKKPDWCPLIDDKPKTTLDLFSYNGETYDI